MVPEISHFWSSATEPNFSNNFGPLSATFIDIQQPLNRKSTGNNREMTGSCQNYLKISIFILFTYLEIWLTE